MNADQLRLLGELADWQLLGIADEPGYWCRHIRDGQGGGTSQDEQWRAAGLWRQTYRWGIAMTTHGDYTHQRGLRDPEHAVAISWQQIATWAERLPAELRADARRARSGTPEERAQVVDRLLGRNKAPSEVEELTLW